MDDRALARFTSFIRLNDETGCWEWTGADDGKGYPQFCHEGGPKKAHRVAYEHFVGAIPDGHHVDHVWDRGCRSTMCVFHGHLEAVTQAENNRRLAAKKTECPHGHPLDGLRGDGRRYCLTCNRERSRGLART